MRGEPPKEMDEALARQRWQERFTWQEGDIQLTDFVHGGQSLHLEDTRALSLRQPWAWLVVNGDKDIENRSWRTHHRGPLLIHASRNRSLVSPENLAAIEKEYDVRLPRDFQFGGVIGVVDLIDCVKQHPSRWKSSGTWGWVLRNPKRLAFTKCKGTMSLFRPKLGQANPSRQYGIPVDERPRALTRRQKAIVREIRALHARRLPLNISAVKRSHPKLIERVYAVRPFWGWKRALEDAGLSYAKINTELLDYVDCKICGRDFGTLQSHLLRMHHISPRDYAREYSDAEFASETFRAKLSHSDRGKFKASVMAHWEAIWTPEYMLDRIAELHRRGFPLNIGWAEVEEKALVNHVKRQFGSWNEALRRTGLNPDQIRLVKSPEKPTPPAVMALLRATRRSGQGRSGLRERKDVIEALRQRALAGRSLGSYALATEDRPLYRAVRQHIGDFEEVYRLFGVWKPRESQWARADKTAIIAELRRRKAGSESLQARKVRSAMSGMAFMSRLKTLFGSWPAALIAAGIEPPKGTRPELVPQGIKTSGAPRGFTVWAEADKAAVLAEIRRRKRANEPLNRQIREERGGRALIRRGRAFFGSWDAALRAVGVQTRVSCWAKAPRAAVVAELRRRKRAGETLLIQKVQREKWGPAFFNRATELFGSWNAALIAADIEPVRENSRWPKANRAAILAEIRRRKRAGQSLSTTVVQKEKWGGALNMRCRVLFGSWRAAIIAAGVDSPIPLHGVWPKAERSAILREIRRRKRTRAALQSTKIAREQCGQALLRRAKVLFGSWNAALLAARG